MIAAKKSKSAIERKGLARLVLGDMVVWNKEGRRRPFAAQMVSEYGEGPFRVVGLTIVGLPHDESVAVYFEYEKEGKKRRDSCAGSWLILHKPDEDEEGGD